MDACSSALHHAQESNAGVAVDASNASNAAMAVLDFDKVEEYARLSTRSGDGTTVSAWINLIHLYLTQGRADAAIEAVSGSLDSLASEEPAMRLQKEQMSMVLLHWFYWRAVKNKMHLRRLIRLLNTLIEEV